MIDENKKKRKRDEGEKVEKGEKEKGDKERVKEKDGEAPSKRARGA